MIEIPRIPDQYNPHPSDNKARDRDITLRWLEGSGIDQVAQRYGLEPEEVKRIIDSKEQKELRADLRQRAIEYTLERFDATAPRNLEILVTLRDKSDDEKMQRMAALDLLEYSSLKKKGEEDGNIGAELFRGIAKLAKEVADDKKDNKERRP